MHESISISNFKCFKDLNVKQLARVNLITGANNAGKTSLLEAVWMLNHPAEPGEALQVSRWRRQEFHNPYGPFEDMFHGQQAGAEITLSSEDHNGQRNTLNIKQERRNDSQQPLIDWSNLPDQEEWDLYGYSLEHELVFKHTSETGGESSTKAWLDLDAGPGRPRPVLKSSRDMSATRPRPCNFRSAGKRHSARKLASLFGAAQMETRVEPFEDLVRTLDPQTQRLTVITDALGVPAVHACMEGGYILPLSMMGDSVRRLLDMTLPFLQLQDGVMLIDEIEHGLHHDAIPAVWKAINRLSQEFNVQVFATTHSYECIKDANDVFSEEGTDELHLIKLGRRKGQPTAVTFTKKMLDTNLAGFWELR